MATSCTTRRRAAASTAASTFLLLVLTPSAAAQESTKYGDFGASAIVITLIGAFFIITAFLSIFLRQLAERCFGTADHQHHLTAARGLDEAAIKSLPTFLYSDVKEHRLGKGDLECAVCLNEFEDHEVLRILPGCSHVFHPHCINPWLRSHATCPVCRRNLNPTTQNEPMVRVVMDGCDGVEDCEESRGESSAAVGSSVDDRRFIGKFPRSHSTGHSMSRHLEDWDRFTLRLPEDLIGSRLHQSGGCGSEHENNVDRWGWLSMTPPFKGPSKLNPSPTNLRSNRMWSPKNLMLRSNKSPVNQATSKDPGEQSSDRLFVQPFV